MRQYRLIMIDPQHELWLKGPEPERAKTHIVADTPQQARESMAAIYLRD